MQKKYIFLSMGIIIFLFLIGPVLNVKANSGLAKFSEQNTAKSRILIVYFSHSGNTRSIAKQIHNRVGGDVVELQTVNTYPTDYNTVVQQAKKELAESYKPPLKNKIINIDDYDVIFLGTPVWWGTIVPPIATFLSEYDLAGKTIIPFCTHAGSQQGRCFTDIAKSCQNSKIIDGIAILGSSAENAQQEIDVWLQKINMIE